MAQVTVKINDREYRMACEDGQEHHLLHLGERFSSYVQQLKNEFGEIGDTRLTVMSGLMILDQVVELERQNKGLRRALEDSKQAESITAQHLLTASEKIDTVVSELMMLE